MIEMARPQVPEDVALAPDWHPIFRLGSVVRTSSEGGAYDRGEIVELAQQPRYYRVDYGLGFPVLVREENLEPFDGNDPLSEPPRSFVPPVPPFAWALR